MIIKEEILILRIKNIEVKLEEIKKNDTHFYCNVDYWKYKGQLDLLYEIRGGKVEYL